MTERLTAVWATLEKAEKPLSALLLQRRLAQERQVDCSLAAIEEALALLLRLGAVRPAGRKGFYRAEGGRA